MSNHARKPREYIHDPRKNFGNLPKISYDQQLQYENRTSTLQPSTQSIGYRLQQSSTSYEVQSEYHGSSTLDSFYESIDSSYNQQDSTVVPVYPIIVPPTEMRINMTAEENTEEKSLDSHQQTQSPYIKPITVQYNKRRKKEKDSVPAIFNNSLSMPEQLKNPVTRLEVVTKNLELWKGSVIPVTHYTSAISDTCGYVPFDEVCRLAFCAEAEIYPMVAVTKSMIKVKNRNKEKIVLGCVNVECTFACNA